MPRLDAVQEPPERRQLGETNLASDLLRGAEEIAEYLFGDRSMRRQIYHLAEKGELPVFKLGSQLCARKSRILAWVESKENDAIQKP